VRNPSFC